VFFPIKAFRCTFLFVFNVLYPRLNSAGALCRLAANTAPKPGAAYCQAYSYDLQVTQAEPSTNPAAIPRPGLWFDPGRPGSGFDLHRTANGQYFLLWYTYTQSGGYPIWYLSDSAPLVRGVWRAPLSLFRWIGGTARGTRVGTVSLEMTGSTKGRFKWVLSGHNQTDDAAFLFGGGRGTGLYFPPSESGWGVSVQGDGRRSVSYAYLYDGSQPRWVTGQRTGLPNDGANIRMWRYTGSGLCPWCGGGTATAASSGTARLMLSGNSGWVSTALALRSGRRWDKTRVPLVALTLH